MTADDESTVDPVRAGGRVALTGQLVCSSAAERNMVLRHLPLHIELSRNEPGCRVFEVRPTADSFVWQVDEEFIDAETFAAHQDRVRQSAWGRATAGIERRYTFEGGDESSITRRDSS